MSTYQNKNRAAWLLACSLALHGTAPAAPASNPAPASMEEMNEKLNPSAVQSGSESGSTSLPAALRAASRERRFVLPTEQELAQAEQLFAGLFQPKAKLSPALQQSARALQMELLQIGPVLALQEAAEARRGRGFYAFYPGRGRSVLQVPHSFKDEMTRDIGLALFAEGSFAAAAWNTVPRRFQDASGREVDADLAHIPGTWFTAFARASARVPGLQRTLQIHGFEQGKRKQASLATSDMILSATHAAPSARLRQDRQCLARALQLNVSLYGVDAKELGGTKNMQAAALRAVSGMEFVHVEMSRDLRSALREQSTLRAAWLRCLLADGV